MSCAGTLVYIILSFSPLISMMCFLIYTIRRKSISRRGSVWEKGFYLFCIIGGNVVWLWNGFYPSPEIFDDRVGLFWGIKTDNVTWTFISDTQSEEKLVFSGNNSMMVSFGEKRGWIIFHHTPLGPPTHRYEEIEFYIKRNDLKNNAVAMRLYGENKKPYPTEKGISINEGHIQICEGSRPNWERARVKIEEFKFPDGRILGIGIGKEDGVDKGSFYLDCIRLIEKKR